MNNNMKNEKEASVKLASSLVIIVVLAVLIGKSSFTFLKHEQEYAKQEIKKCQICIEDKTYNYEEVLTSVKLHQQEVSSESFSIQRAKEEAKRTGEMKHHIEAIRVEYEKKRKAELEKERLSRLEEKKKEEAKRQSVSRGSSYKGANEDLGVFNVSWYGADCYQCSGITATGIPVKNSIYYQGYGVVASDWSVIPPFSIIEVEGYGQYIVIDKGGAIKGKKLDLLTTSEVKSNEYGRQHLNVKVLRWGKKQ